MAVARGLSSLSVGVGEGWWGCMRFGLVVAVAAVVAAVVIVVVAVGAAVVVVGVVDGTAAAVAVSAEVIPVALTVTLSSSDGHS